MPYNEEPFRWQNCYADVAASQHDRIVLNYFADVIKPSIAALDAKIAEYAASDDPVAMFYESDVKDVRHETLLAFALALQSIWERQLRNYLAGCARHLPMPSVTPNMVAKANWEKLREHFKAMRGISLELFPSFPELDVLQLLGNACRHGEGPSAALLWIRRPALWPPRVQFPFEGMTEDNSPQSPEQIDLTVTDLEGFANAIAAFWNDATYIYNESLASKHSSLEETLVRERATRTWTPRAGDLD